ncbi:unnamed protein product [Sphagnum balticum]
MQQQQQQMAAYAAGTTITTELIQKYLDENKQLILAILDNQNLGQLNECATYQAKLQQNLMYLAAIADAQPQAVQSSPRAAPVPSMQPAQQYLQQQQQQQQQQLMMNQRTPIPQYLQQSQQVSPHLSQHSYHNQQGMVSGAGAGMHLMSGDGSTGAGNGPQSMGGSSEYGNNPSGSRNGNQTMSSAEGGVAGSSPLGHPGRDGGSVHGGDTSSEVSYLQGSEEDAQ